ncbi:hypothetical protein [Nocardioides speluncae]|uniref:hypothetical protein n=1 Tax=Nocardioides speluncae TaxID=2670337 RepID=UPI000D696CBB|nr:hypothetical protein [Nocardioides speluncae]
MNGPASDDRRARTGTIALVLGALSTLALLAAVATAAVLALGDDAAATDGSERPPKPSVPKAEFEGGQPIYGDRLQNVQFEVPAVDTGWTLSSPDYEVGFEGGPETDRASVRGQVAFYRTGWCTDEEGVEQHAGFVGFERAEKSDDPEAVSKEIADHWVNITSYRDDDKTHHEYTDVTTDEIELGDGESAYLSRSVITIAEADQEKCSSPELEIDVLSLDAGDHVATVVLARDKGTSEAMSDEAVDDVLATVRKAA